jgi:hypothetical protein
MSTATKDANAQEAQTPPSTVYVNPADFKEWIAPLLRKNPALRARILREILKQPHAMIAVYLNPDWDTVDKATGLPQRFELDEVRSLPRQMYADLVAHSRLPDNAYSDRSVWRTALLKAAL